MTAEPTDREPAFGRSRVRRLLSAALLFAMGGYLGNQAAHGVGGGFAEVLSSILANLVIGLLLVVTVVIGVGSLLRRDGQGRADARAAFAAAGLLMAGYGGGYATVALVALLFPPPVVIELSPKSAAMTLRLQDQTWVVADTDGLGTCQIEPDGTVRFVITEEAGRLQAKPMSAQLDLGAEARVGAEVQLALIVNILKPSSVVPGALVAAISGDGYISWVGPAVLAEVAALGTSGRATFVDLPVTGEPPLGWPTSLSGEVSWTCT